MNQNTRSFILLLKDLCKAHNVVFLGEEDRPAFLRIDGEDLEVIYTETDGLWHRPTQPEWEEVVESEKARVNLDDDIPF